VGEGACAPSPVSAFNMPASPTPPGLRPPPPPLPGRGIVMAIPGERPYPGKRAPAPALSSGSPIHWTVGGILLWGRGQKPPCLSAFNMPASPTPPMHSEALSPAGPGRGQSWRYPGNSRTQENEPLRRPFLQVLPYTGPWEVSPRGEGAKAPLSLCFQYVGIPHPARPPASSPAPPGTGDSHGDTRGKAVPGKMSPCTGPFFRFSHTLDRGGYTPVGEGAKAPLSLCFQYAGIPHPARPPASSPAPPGAGAVVAIPGE
jgi:hypothetical protein